MISHANTTVDLIIVGQGLTGSVLAMNAVNKNQSVLVIDDHHASAASTVAAGIITPIKGQRLSLNWHSNQDLEFVIQCYRSLEQQLDTHLLNERTLIRFLNKDIEQQSFQKKQTDPAYKTYLNQPVPAADYKQWFSNCHDGFSIAPVYQLMIGQLLSAVKTWLIKNSSYHQSVFDYESLTMHEDHVSWHDITAKRIVFCEGYRASQNPFFGDLPFQHAKGDILELHCDGLPENTIFNGGQWLCPMSTTTYRFGTNTTWDFSDHHPDSTSIHSLEQDLCDFLHHPYSIKTSLTGVRPTLRYRQPIYGHHPTSPMICIINGMGGHGSFLVPHVIAKFLNQSNMLQKFSL
jgi:glycine/D-amino acid oxidase-like deaminating enzyme